MRRRVLFLALVLVFPILQACHSPKNDPFGPSPDAVRVPTEIATNRGISFTVPPGWALLEDKFAPGQPSSRPSIVVAKRQSYHEGGYVFVAQAEKAKVAPTFPTQKAFRKMSEAQKSAFAKRYAEDIGASPPLLFEHTIFPNPNTEGYLRRTEIHEINGQYYIVSRSLSRNALFYTVWAETELNGRFKVIRVYYTAEPITPAMMNEMEAIISSVRVVASEARP